MPLVLDFCDLTLGDYLGKIKCEMLTDLSTILY